MATSLIGYWPPHPWIQAAFTGALIGIIGIVLFTGALRLWHLMQKERRWRQLLILDSAAHHLVGNTKSGWLKQVLLKPRSSQLK